MGDHHHAQKVPKGVLLAAGALLTLTLVLAAGARMVHAAHPAPPLPPPLAVLEVRFEDRPDGAIAMLDAASGRELSVVPPRTNGFIRGVLRGMFRNRRLESLGPDGTFRLAREADGRLSLQDEQTGRRVDLGAFGPTNSAAFAELLAAGSPGGR